MTGWADIAQQNQALLTAALEKLAAAERERDRLEGEALAALSKAGLATPAEGYLRAPGWLKSDIGRLAQMRDHAQDTLQDQTAELAADVARVTAERDSARSVAVSLENEVARLTDERDYARTALESAVQQADYWKACARGAHDLCWVDGGYCCTCGAKGGQS